MLFLVEMDHVKSGGMPTRESGSSFIREIILPTLSGIDRLVAEKKITAGGPVAGQVALRLMVQAESPGEIDAMISSLPLWSVAETRVTPLIGASERRMHVETLLERLGDP